LKDDVFLEDASTLVPPYQEPPAIQIAFRKRRDSLNTVPTISDVDDGPSLRSQLLHLPQDSNIPPTLKAHPPAAGGHAFNREGKAYPSPGASPVYLNRDKPTSGKAVELNGRGSENVPQDTPPSSQHDNLVHPNIDATRLQTGLLPFRAMTGNAGKRGMPRCTPCRKLKRKVFIP
jgi:hypothetical protein